MQKIIVFLLMLFAASNMYGQQTVTKYFDSNWVEVSKDSAFYYTNFEKQDTAYKVTSYWAASNKLRATSTFADTNFIKGIGLIKRYYESGQVEDSMYFSKSGNMQTGYHYTPTGKLDYRIFYDSAKQQISGEKYDSLGKKSPVFFTFQREAMFPGGLAGWANYLQENLRGNIPAKKKAPAGRYVVTVSFIVDKNGKVSEVKALNDPGYGTAEEAIRVLQKSPDWMPAVQNDKPVNFRQKQNIVFEVTEK